MTRTQHVFTTALTANEIFKLRYPRYLKGAVLGALVVTILAVWLWPDIPARPYQLRERTELVLVEVPDTIDIEEPPAPAPAPRVPPNIQVADPGEEPSPQEGDWSSRLLPDPPVIPTYRPGDYDGFVASATKPMLVMQARADYPEIARRSGIEGTVVVKVLVGVEGRVEQAVIVSKAHPILDKEALLAARKCRFTPARQREMKVAVWVAVPYRFKLR